LRNLRKRITSFEKFKESTCWFGILINMEEEKLLKEFKERACCIGTLFNMKEERY
jgi:uncharacterized Fe-S cluster-containing protein